MESKIKVGVRIRPLNSKELEASSPSVVGSEASKFVITKPPAKKTSFEYDWSFNQASSNRDVYEKSCRPLIENIFDGFNATFFAYGQTSSGKTHTLGGAEMTEGVIPFALQDIFARRKELQTMGTKVDIELSYIEIYREECFDLLSANGDRAKLELKETSTGKTALDGVTCQPVQDIESVMDFLREGAKVRSTGQTAMNAHSSRSHSICTLNLRVVRATTGAVTSQLHLVDLAGSERAKKTQATGDAFQEGISINRGLLALGNVVSALASRSARGNVGAGGGADNGHIHVPYRESKLTRLLKDALGGNGMTVMLACVSPAETNFEETLNTLRFASRASAIVNSVRVNHSVGDTTDTAALLKEIQELRDQVTLLQCDKTVNAAKSGATTASAAAGSKSISNATAAASAEATSKDLAEYHYMVSAALHITTALKTVLVTCLQEGSYVIDSDLLNIQAELQHIRKGLNLPVKASATLMTKPTTSATFANVNTSSAVVKAENKNGGTATAAEATAADDAAVVIELDMDAMLQLPPIMTVIEEVRLLEKDLKALEKSTRGGGYSPQQQLGSSGAQSSTQQHAQGRGGGGGGAAAAVNALRMSLSSDWSAEDSMISCIEDNGGGDGCSANNSFEESFDCIAQDCDAHMQEGSGASAVSAFDVDCSFNDLDNIYMGDAIAEFMASQAQQGAGAAAVTKGSVTTTTTSAAASGGGVAKLSYVEEEAVRQASKGLVVKEAEVTRIAALTDKYQNSIKTLKAEIAALETDQEKLQSKQQQQQRRPLTSVTTTTSSSNASTTSGATGAGGAKSSFSAPTSAASSVDELRIKRELKEKSKLLEEKIKLLRAKEAEFGKISTQKTRLVGEVESMKKVVEDGKRRRAELQRKMRDEATMHRQESQQVKHSELQARRRELQAQQSVVRLEGQLVNKERVWKAQLESKERESKQLKELVGKQQVVRTMQQYGKGAATGGSAGVSGGSGSSSAGTASMFAAAGALLTSQGSGLTTQEALNLKLWVDRELEVQSKRAAAQEALSREMLLRTKAAKTLQAARQQQQASAGGDTATAVAALNTSIDSTSSGGAALTATAMKALEHEIRTRSATIAGLNGTITELGPASSADRKRFSRFTDLKETRLVAEVLFEVSVKSQKREHLASRRLRSVQEQLARTKKALAEANASVVHYQQVAERAERAKGYIFDDEESFECAEMDETFYPSDDGSDAEASVCSDDDDSYCRTRPNRTGRKKGWASANTSAGGGGGGNKRKVDISDSSMDLSAENVPKKIRAGNDAAASGAGDKKTTTAKRVQIQETRRDQGSSNSSGGAGASDVSDDEQSDSSADGSEDSDSEDEDNADEGGGRQRKRNGGGDKKTTTRKPAAAKKAGAGGEGALVKKAHKRVNCVDPDFDDAEITFPLAKHTISDLKRFLAAKGLPVSGVKAELIKRLQAVLPNQETPVNNENDSPCQQQQELGVLESPVEAAVEVDVMEI